MSVSRIVTERCPTVNRFMVRLCHRQSIYGGDAICSFQFQMEVDFLTFGRQTIWPDMYDNASQTSDPTSVQWTKLLLVGQLTSLTL